jgi:hypothetical protein
VLCCAALRCAVCAFAAEETNEDDDESDNDRKLMAGGQHLLQLQIPNLKL